MMYSTEGGKYRGWQNKNEYSERCYLISTKVHVVHVKHTQTLWSSIHYERYLYIIIPHNTQTLHTSTQKAMNQVSTTLIDLLPPDLSPPPTHQSGCRVVHVGSCHCFEGYPPYQSSLSDLHHPLAERLSQQLHIEKETIKYMYRYH